MKVIVRNVNRSLMFTLTVLKVSGFMLPDKLSPIEQTLYKVYTFVSFMVILGSYLIVQFGDMCQIWGDVGLMTGNFLLFTNMALIVKVVNILVRRETVQMLVEDCDEELSNVSGEEENDIIKSCDNETFNHLRAYISLIIVTVIGWAASAENNKLPFRAWYPYNAYKSPVYEITYAHQLGALVISACVNMSLDMLITSLVAQCRCRLKLLGLALSKLCQGLHCDTKQLILSPEQEVIAYERLRVLIKRHQSVLSAIPVIESCFSVPIFVQFTVSLAIICVAAYQMAFESKSIVHVLTSLGYLVGMTLQVFFYCYQGHHLTEESANVSMGAYNSEWTSCSRRVRTLLLMVQVRAADLMKITAGGLTTLNLNTFVAIIKSSYSLFTVLQHMNDKKSA